MNFNIITPKIHEAIELPRNQPKNIVKKASAVMSPKPNKTLQPQAAPIILDTMVAKTVNTNQSLPVLSLGSALKALNAIPPTIPCAKFPGMYAIDTGSAADPEIAFEIIGNTIEAIPPHPPYQMLLTD